MMNWIVAHACGWELFLPFVLLQAALLAYARSKRRPMWDILIFLGTWLAAVAAFLTLSRILQRSNNLPALAAGLLMVGFCALCPFVCAQLASALFRRPRSHLAYGAAVFATGMIAGVPLLAVTNATLTPFVSHLIKRT